MPRNYPITGQDKQVGVPDLKNDAQVRDAMVITRAKISFIKQWWNQSKGEATTEADLTYEIPQSPKITSHGAHGQGYYDATFYPF